MSIIASGKVIAFFLTVAFVLLVFYFSQSVKKGKEYQIRRLPALDAIEEAVGRCIEMGTPIMIQPGSFTFTGSLTADTVAALSICGYAIDVSADKGCDVRIPVGFPEVMIVLSEQLKSSLRRVGELDRYNPDTQIIYTGPNQFSYTAAVQGIIERDKVKSSIMVGGYAANSLIIAESMAREDVFAIAGSTNLYQIPWMLAICNYMLIGEELLASAAYLNREPGQVASIVADDIYKFLAIALIIVGVILLSMGNTLLIDLLTL